MNPAKLAIPALAALLLAGCATTPVDPLPAACALAEATADELTDLTSLAATATTPASMQKYIDRMVEVVPGFDQAAGMADELAIPLRRASAALGLFFRASEKVMRGESADTSGPLADLALAMHDTEKVCGY